MPKAKDIKSIVIHCSAGFSKRKDIEAFWKSKGWKAPGYHRLVEVDGKIEKLAEFNTITNGVLGFNSSTLHICYVGGIEVSGTKEKPVYKGKDTRTAAQKQSILKCIEEALQWLKTNGNTNKITIKGHRDFSPDKNGNGVIESWERIKECPSFDAITEYKHLT
ncbi:MAG TPA: N-acetylmuramoyl-L-alanine amidase [Candidatus Paceibacterota bacterium]|nr:N-acetylmuramoyl-L-alanine amidase [Candidatus Paceibacterota bacterium]